MWKIKLNVKWLHLLSKLRVVYHRFLEDVKKKSMNVKSVKKQCEEECKINNQAVSVTKDTPEAPTRMNTIHSSSEEIHALNPKKADLSLSHSTIPASGEMTTIMARGNGGDFSPVDHSDQISVNIRASSEKHGIQEHGRTDEKSFGTMPGERNELEEESSHKNKIKRKIIEGLLSISVLGIKITSMLILPLCGVFTSCVESE